MHKSETRSPISKQLEHTHRTAHPMSVKLVPPFTKETAHRKFLADYQIRSSPDPPSFREGQVGPKAMEYA